MGENCQPDATARRWFDNHPDLYATPEYRRVRVAVISPATLAPDITISDKDLEAAYQTVVEERICESTVNA